MGSQLQASHPSELSAQARKAVRRRSKKMFGSSDRLEVAVAIALKRDGVANATELQWELQLAANRVRTQLLALAELGLLAEGPPGENGKRMFMRVNDPFWDLCLEKYSAWSG